MAGGTGNDSYVVLGGGSGNVIENVDEGIDNVASYGDYALSDHVENLRLLGEFSGNGADLYTGSYRIGAGNSLDNVIVGSGNADWLDGLDGADNIDGRAGDDLISGGAGNDTLYGGDDAVYIDEINLVNGGPVALRAANADTIYGGAGEDTIDGGSVNDLLFGNDGDDYIYGGDDGLMSGGGIGGGTDGESKGMVKQLVNLNIKTSTIEEKELTAGLLQAQEILFIHSLHKHNDVINKPDNFQLFLENSPLLKKFKQ